MRLANPRRRLRFALAVMCIVMSLFVVRLAQLQALDASTYAEAADLALRQEVVLPAQRGDILDRSGQPLVTTAEAVRLVVNQTQVTNPAAAALVLAPTLGRDELQLQTVLTGNDRYAIVAKQLTAGQWRHIRELGIAGLTGEPETERVYPNGPIAANLLGFLSEQEGVDVAMSGIEDRYDKTLAGTAGFRVYEQGIMGGQLPQGENTTVDPTPGSSIQLTIDRDLQWYLEQLLAERVEAVKAESASAMVVEAKTGRILAIATYPTFDPSDPTTINGDDDVENRVINEAYEPGSVQKPITMAALLDAGVVVPGSTVVATDSIRRNGHTIHDFEAHEPQELTMAGVIARSSNVGTLLATEKLPTDELIKYLQRFGYGKAPNLGLNGENPGVLPDADIATSLDRDTMSFGQTLAVSLPQIASGYQTLANDGVRIPLRLVDAVIEADGTERPLPNPDAKRVVSKEAAQAVTTMMEAVVSEGGTASNIKVPGYRIAGKTGTAQKYNAECGCYRGYTASFMGYAPADDPEVVVTVSVQNPTKTRYGGQTAGPIWTEIMGLSLQTLGVVPSGSPAPRVPLYASAAR